MSVSYKPIFFCDGVWCRNGQAFATREEADKSARARFARWTMPTNYGVEEATEPVSFRWDDEEGDVMLSEEKAS